MDTFIDELMEDCQIYHAVDFSKSSETLFFFEFLRLNKSYNFMAVHDNGLTFLKIGYNLKNQTKFEIAQKKTIALKKLLAVAYDYRSETLAINFENEPNLLKVFKLDDAYFKSQTPLYKIAIPQKLTTPSMLSNAFKLHPHFYSASLEYQMLLFRKQYSTKFDLVSLYGEMYILVINIEAFTLSLVNLQTSQLSVYKLPESGCLNRRAELQRARQSRRSPLQHQSHLNHHRR